MNKKVLSLAIAMALAIPTASNALSLGEIESRSSLNQPFQGRIDLLQTNPAEVQSLRVRVASPEVFNRVGIDRPAFLNNIQFRTTVQNGRPVILVSSNQPINEPFLNFLLEVSWPNGQLLKEYTVLLDPPALLRPNTAIASSNAGVRAEPVAQGNINRPTAQQLQAQRQRQAQQLQRQRQAQQQRQVQQQRQAQQRQAQAQQRRIQQQRQTQAQRQGETLFERQARQVLNGQVPNRQTARRVAAAQVSGNYRVRRGDTLSKIASRLGYNGINKDQMMMALFAKNRAAFNRGNINNLKAGVVLARPSVQEARSLNTRAARSQIIAQARAWKASRGQQLASNSSNNNARLEVLGQGNNNASSTSGSRAGSSAQVADLNKQLALLTESLSSKQSENTELGSRVAELESLLRKKNRLIALKSEQLASLQATMNGSTTQPDLNQQNQVVSNSQTNQQVNTQLQQNNNVEQMGTDINAQVTGQNANQNGEIVRTQNEQVTINDNSQSEIEPLRTETQEIPIEVSQENTDPFKSTDETGMDIMGLVTSPVGIGAGLGSLALLGAFAFMRRRKNDDGEFEDFSDLIDNGLNGEVFDDSEETVYNEDDQVYSNDHMNNETDYSEHEQGRPVQHAVTEDVVSGEDELEELIQEADVYIVYGLHDQAESEIKRAISSHPNNAALHAKLLENYKAAGDIPAFEKATKVFMDLDADDKQNYWDDISEWGNELLPDSKLYKNATLVKAAAVTTGAVMVAGTAVATKAAEVMDMSVEADQQVEADILAEFDNVDLNADVDEIEFNDLESVLDAEEQKLSEDSDLSDDLSALMDESLNDTVEISDDIDTDFLLDDDLFSDDSDQMTDARNLNLEIEGNDFDKIMPEQHAYKVAESEASVEESNILADFDENLSFLDLEDDTEAVGETQIEIKIDLAKAYIDMGDIEGARSTLAEVMELGSDEQKREAKALLHQNG